MSPIPIFLLPLFLLHHHVTSTNLQNIHYEGFALLRFFKALHHIDTELYKNWISQAQNSPLPFPCSWKGVLCDPTNTTVIQLDLYSSGLTGQIEPQTLSCLSSLLVLGLNDNHLTGTLPSDFSDLTLNELYLQNNNFSGDLSYIRADELERLNVSNNDFKCAIPYSLYDKFPNHSEVFAGNEKLCNFNTSSYYCDFGSKYNIECPIQYGLWRDYRIRRRKNQAIVGVSVVLGLPILIFLCWLPKKIINQPSSGADPVVDGKLAARAGNPKLVFVADVVRCFDYEDLLPASGEVLGKGSVGTSYKVVLDEKDMLVFLKRLNGVKVSESEFKSQMEVLGKTKSEHVVPLKAFYYSHKEKFLVYDYIPADSLSTRLHGLRGVGETRLNLNHRMKIALIVGKGVAFLHASNVVHGNIKSSNVLIRQGTTIDVIVSDYGLYTLFGKWGFPNHQVSYWAPEVVKTQKFSFKTDVYSFGVLLLELLTGKAPNYQPSDGWNDFSMWVQMVVSEQPTIEIFDVELRTGQNINEMFQMLQIAKVCVSIVPNHRPTMETIVSMLSEIIQDKADHCFGRPIIGLG